MTIADPFNRALASWLEAHGSQGLADHSRHLQSAYRAGQNSSQVSSAAYVAARAPATYGANAAVQKALATAMPGFEPRTLLDVGAGPGTASWAALQQFPSLDKITQVEQDHNFAALAKALNREGVTALQHAQVLEQPITLVEHSITAELVVASYVLAELPLEAMPEMGKRLWARAEQVLVLIEPGTPQGFARLASIRSLFAKHVLAPCTHQLACPLQHGDWCHFKTRVQRSRAHMQAKQAQVPFEDESFSYLVLARNAVATDAARIIAPPSTSKVAVSMRLCQHGEVRNVQVASRDKDKYKRAKKATWGALWE